MIGRAALLAWMLGAFAACGSARGRARRRRARAAASAPEARSRSTGGRAGTRSAPPARAAAADAPGDSGFVAGGALDTAPGIYIVPAGPDTPEVRYPISNPRSRTTAESFRIDYNMPTLLVGGDQMVSLRGTLDAQGRLRDVSGDAGSATCDLAPGDGFSVRCNETLERDPGRSWRGAANGTVAARADGRAVRRRRVPLLRRADRRRRDPLAGLHQYLGLNARLDLPFAG